MSRDGITGGLNNGQSSDNLDMIDNLRNYHVKKLLTKLGGRSVASDVQKAIKRSYSEYAEDTMDIIKGQYNDEQDDDRFNR